LIVACVAIVFQPFRDRRRRNAARAREPSRIDPGAAHRFSQNIAKRVFEGQSFIGHRPRISTEAPRRLQPGRRGREETLSF
jgi:hypothetical protein